ncbi:MAG: sigma-54 dependent transcriptional regulator [Desulfarculaceae bacterium]
MPTEKSSLSALMVDDSAATIKLLEGLLKNTGAAARQASSTAEALTMVEQDYFDVVFLSWGLDSAPTFVNQIQELFPETLLMVILPKPSLGDTVEAMRLGAFNVMPHPLKKEAVAKALEEALEYRSASREQGEARRRLRRKYDVENIVGQSKPMQEVFRLIHKVAATDTTVLILGESGTGKELVARAIHYQSPRNPNPLVPVNCGAIPEELLESELFGHEKGAFTGAIKTRLGRFEQAEGGTIFLDEIGDMSPMLQVKLLRVLQEHQFERIGGAKTINADIRIIAATNQDLGKRVEQGHFREDLYYRLNVVPIQVPPLRERRSDIALLAQYFLRRLGQEKGLGEKKILPEVVECLLRYAWPGNVRELENLLERMVILADGDTIAAEDLPEHMAGDRALSAAPVETQAVLHTLEVPEDGLDFNAQVDALERSLILQALELTGGVKNQAAALLRLNRTTLVEKIKKKGLTFPPQQTGSS